MRSMRSAFLVAVLAFSAFAPAAAGAEPLPPYDGMSFQTIQGPEGPEEFTWEVQLGEEQELRQIDDREAGVYYTDPGETRAFAIKATAAHDAEGVTVPTTIAVTQPNIVTLTVHHRDGNAAAGGAPFDYPISAGEGWEGGFQTYQVVMPPGELPQATSVAAHCLVPDLGGRTLRAARKILRRSHCKLGEVRGERRRGARVVRQFRLAGKSLPAGTEVGVKLLRP
ncbi:MAG TPA: hypothetical protein VFU11_03000 [Solirubrobacterales bacterium]|nr:hypothetical protein [Solirubrobacterales bacterium]